MATAPKIRTRPSVTTTKLPTWATANPDGTMTIALETPIELAGVKVANVTMRRCLLQDRMAVANGGDVDNEEEMILLGSLCDLAPSELGEMDLSDYSKLGWAFSSFIDMKTEDDTSSYLKKNPDGSVSVATKQSGRGLVSLRKPKVRDRLAASKVGTEEAWQELHLVCALSGLTQEEAMALDLLDYMRISRGLTVFQVSGG